MRTILLMLVMVLPVMAGREFVAGSSQLGVGAIEPIDPPFTVVARGLAQQNSASAILLSVDTTTNAFERVQVNFVGALAGDPIYLSAVNAAGAAADAVGSGFATNTWHHIAAVVASSTSRVLWVDGVARVTNTTSIAVNGLNQVAIGARKNTSYGTFWTGGIAEVAIWSAALTDAEIASLASGAAPFMIRPASLVFYAPLTGRETSTEWNLYGSAVSLTNAPTASILHPRIYRP